MFLRGMDALPVTPFFTGLPSELPETLEYTGEFGTELVFFLPF
jgi:hypothetical protein